MIPKTTLTGLAGLLSHDSVRRLRDADDTWHYSVLDVLALGEAFAYALLFGVRIRHEHSDSRVA